MRAGEKNEVRGRAGQEQQQLPSANLPGNFYYFFKHFLELNDGGRQPNAPLFKFSFFFLSILWSEEEEAVEGARLRFVFFLMGNFLGSKWARFMNAFVGCLWGGADAQPYSHPPFESHPLKHAPCGRKRMQVSFAIFFFQNGILNCH